MVRSREKSLEAPQSREASRWRNPEPGHTGLLEATGRSLSLFQRQQETVLVL